MSAEVRMSWTNISDPIMQCRAERSSSSLLGWDSKENPVREADG